jgi:hypothetical protein
VDAEGESIDCNGNDCNGTGAGARDELETMARDDRQGKGSDPQWTSRKSLHNMLFHESSLNGMGGFQAAEDQEYETIIQWFKTLQQVYQEDKRPRTIATQSVRTGVGD